MEPPLHIEFDQNNLIQFLNRNKHADTTERLN